LGAGNSTYARPLIAFPLPAGGRRGRDLWPESSTTSS